MAVVASRLADTSRSAAVSRRRWWSEAGSRIAVATRSSSQARGRPIGIDGNQPVRQDRGLSRAGTRVNRYGTTDSMAIPTTLPVVELSAERTAPDARFEALTAPELLVRPNTVCELAARRVWVS